MMDDPCAYWLATEEEFTYWGWAAYELDIPTNEECIVVLVGRGLQRYGNPALLFKYAPRYGMRYRPKDPLSDEYHCGQVDAMAHAALSAFAKNPVRP